MSKHNFLFLLGSIFFWVVCFFATIGLAQATTITHSVGTASEFNIRFDGPASTGGVTAFTGRHTTIVKDLDSNGEMDLIISARGADNTAQDTGSVYIIYDSLFESLSGTGNIIDLTTASNYNIRIDGAVASDGLGAEHFATGDFDNDGLPDLIVGATQADTNGANSGAVYIFYNTLLDDYSGTGNIISLASSTSYNIRREEC
jgi:hypothetical protein